MTVPHPIPAAPRKLLLIVGATLCILTVVYVRGPLSAYVSVEASWINFDQFTYYLPNYEAAWGRLRQGELPLWNPYQQAGTPIIPPLQAGVFYPGNIAFLFLPTPQAMEFTAILHIALTGLFAAWYVSKQGAGVAGVGAAAILGAFGADVLQRFWVNEFLHASPWIFVCLIALESLLHNPTRRGAAGLALAYGVQFLAGWPQCSILTGYLLTARVLWHLFSRTGRQTAPQALGALVFAVVMWIGLTAAQLFPTVELLPYALRNPEGLSVAAVEGNALSYSAERLVFDMVDGNPTTRLKKPYIGALGVFLVVFAWLHNERRKTVAFWSLVFGVASLMAMGLSGPLYAVFYHFIPTGNWFRDPPRFLYLAHTAATVLVAYGADALATRLSTEKQTPSRALPVLTAVIAVIGLVFALYGSRETGLRMGSPALGNWMHGLRPWSLWITVSAAAIAFALVRRTRRTAMCVVAMLGCVWIADLFYANRNLHAIAWQRAPYIIDPPTLGALSHTDVAGPRSYLLSDFLDFELNPKLGTLLGLPQVDDYENLHQGRHSRFFYFAEHGEPAPADLLTSGRTALSLQAVHPHMLDLLSVRWIALRSDATRLTEDPQWPGQLPEGVLDTTTPESRAESILLATNTRALPRAYIATHAEAIRDEGAALHRISQEAVLSGQTVVLHAEVVAQTHADHAEANGRADITGYTAERVHVQATTDVAGWLVLTDSWYPGWRATVNGQPSTLYRANVLVRAVAIPAGKSTVVFEFRPKVQYVGIVVSLLSLGVVAVLIRKAKAKP